MIYELIGIWYIHPNVSKTNNLSLLHRSKHINRVLAIHAQLIRNGHSHDPFIVFKLLHSYYYYIKIKIYNCHIYIILIIYHPILIFIII